MIDSLRGLGWVLRPPPYDPDADDHIIMLREARDVADRARAEAMP